MDTPRRWQVASLATAVAGLSVGGIMMGRAPSEAVPAIELEVAADGRDGVEAPGAPERDGAGIELVPPSVLEDPTPPSPESVASPEEPGAGGSGSPGGDSASTLPGDDPGSPGSPDSPGSVSSPDSVDSDDGS